jgi:transcriptional regulator with GAF, ATPase, and Fis domain
MGAQREGAGRERLVLDTFTQLADTLAADYDIGEFLQMLVERCADVLEVTTGGVLLEAAEGELRLGAATSDKMKELEDLEIAAEEGPCIEAYRTCTQVLCADLREAEHRWPKAAPKAVEIGLLAVCAFPMRLRNNTIGALNLYRESTGEFREEDIRLAQAFADIGTIGILHQRKIEDAERRAEQLQSALESRVLVEQANGIVAERYGMSTQRAFEAIRKHARNTNRKLREVCEEIVAGGDPVRP